MTPIRPALVAALAVLVFTCAPVSAQPDVVLIVADDLGFGDVGYNGSEIRTPNLDALAAEGVVLDRFYVSPLCSPSRAGLLTGRYGVRMGINEPVTNADTVGLPQAEVTLAEALGEAGYETAAVGKWHLGDDCAFHPLLHGFDSFLGMLGGGGNYFTRQTAVGPDWWRGVAPVDTGGYTTTLIADEAVEILRRPRDGPLFLYRPFTAPHAPLQALDEDLALYPDLPEPRRTYAAMTTRLDLAVGRVMEAVRQSDRPTLVWFLSDNGAVEREGGDNGRLRGGKGQTYEGGTRVPSVVWYPAWGSREVAHPVWYLDVVPTVLGLVPSASAPALPLDGADQGAQLAGAPPTDALLDRVLYSYRRTGGDNYWLSAQTAAWKYLEQRANNRLLQRLFRIDEDPFEETNVPSEREIGEGLRQAATAFAGLTLPGAAHDQSLVAQLPPDLSECPGELAGPPLPPLVGELSLRVGPNPVTSSGAVRLRSDRVRRLRVDLFDAIGRRVRTLYTGTVGPQGELVVRFGRGGLPSGLYVMRATADDASVSARVVLTR